jgi:hypothetical protein
VRCPTGTILHGENEVFQWNGNYFPKVSFTLDVIWGHMGHYFLFIFFLRPRSTNLFTGVFGRWRSHPFPDLHSGSDHDASEWSANLTLFLSLSCPSLCIWPDQTKSGMQLFATSSNENDSWFPWLNHEWAWGEITYGLWRVVKLALGRFRGSLIVEPSGCDRTDGYYYSVVHYLLFLSPL